MNLLPGKKSVSVIGGGISGLVAASFLAKQGCDVKLWEKNASIGGRARVMHDRGFVFDMGPSWYWMPDVFEEFFNAFGKSAGDYFTLVQLDPGFQVILSENDVIKVPASADALMDLFEAREKGSAARLRKLLLAAEKKYHIGMKKLVKTPSYNWIEFLKPALFPAVFQLDLFRSVKKYVRSQFKDPALISLLEFPVLFLGAMPDQIPALYTLMNHAALTQGTFYPMGGMGKLIEAVAGLAASLGVDIKTGAPVNKIIVKNGQATSLMVNDQVQALDGIIVSCDYYYAEKNLLAPQLRNYNEKYWETKTMAPSCLLFYLGIDKPVPRLEHHNLFFDTDFDRHAKEIYSSPAWPKDPLFYVCAPSKTDNSVAPGGMENLFLLVPVAAGLHDEEGIRETYFEKIINRLSSFCKVNIKDSIIVKHSYCVKDFEQDYNAYKGNAYGLANTLRQTAVWKPSLRNKHVNNLFYTGQLTVPGPGLPPAVISGELAAGQLIKFFKHSLQ